MPDIRKMVLDCLATGELDKYALEVLHRIAGSRDAQAALNAISKDDKQVSWLISDMHQCRNVDAEVFRVACGGA